MTPQEFLAAANEIHDRYPDAAVYVNPPPALNRYRMNPQIPVGAIAVDLDRAWPHKCPLDDDEDECLACSGWYELVAWIDPLRGQVHHVDVPFRED
ncbi:hypothetical protein PBI_ESTAVE1_22 [Mycobacterium phage Estave1]|uniref:Uncharacterized protein n=1 Tax=Mycobacterium phage Estave1 TaxID=1536603 RepID=A0A088F7E8_9CAUD|nr:hypothetical protein PBI_ESTAVE1_22 [Mycobacterium phage Estave1]AIM40412.1 hypothetical protein PBI_ESTAVE1_22 [Mycobacterium phage Estave1]